MSQDTIKRATEYLEKINHKFTKFSLDPFKNFRAYMNITIPYDLSDDFYEEEKEILQNELKKKKITKVSDIEILRDRMCVVKSDITLIDADAIVNAGNSALLGCFHPLHDCVDNAIHSFAGLEVRRDLLKEMQGKTLPNGDAKYTKAYNLPSKYIIHTVGPIVYGGRPSRYDMIELSNCYKNSLAIADSLNLKTIAFSSISTGVFGYPIDKATTLSIEAVEEYFRGNPSSGIEKVIFDVFDESRFNLYYRELTK